MSFITRDDLSANPSYGDGGRSLNTPFQPSDTRPSIVTYSIKMVAAATANLTGGRCELRIDGNNPPTTIRSEVRMQWKVTGTLTTMLLEYTGVLIGFVPKGSWVEIRAISENGNPTASITRQTEIIL